MSRVATERKSTPVTVDELTRRGYQAARRGNAARAGMMRPMAETGASGGYQHVRVPGYPALISAVALSRLANSMSQVGVVIYLLEATHSPAIAGAGAAAQLLPGILPGRSSAPG